MKERVYYFDNARFWLMMGVILHHCTFPYHSVSHFDWVKYLCCILFPVLMPTFTMISGYFFKPKPLVHRVNTYLIPCIVFSVLYICLQYISPVPSMHNRPITQFGYAMWYLWALFIYAIITQHAIKKVSITLLITGSIILALSLCNFKFFTGSNYQLSRLISHYPFFLIGIMLREKQWLKLRENQTIRLLSIALFVILLLFNYALCKYTGRFHFLCGFAQPYAFYVELYGIALSALLGVCLLLFIPDRSYITAKWGSRTMTPYLLHMSLIIPICWTIGIPFMNTWYGYILYLIITPLMCLMLFSTTITNAFNHFLDIIKIRSDKT